VVGTPKDVNGNRFAFEVADRPHALVSEKLIATRMNPRYCDE
jgi:hypothetical protein